MGPKIAVAPPAPEFEDAARAGGATITGTDEADGIIWSIPRKPEELKALLERSPARWVQLPFAGIERFFEAGAIDPARTWTCAKGIYGPATAEGALAVLLGAARRIHQHARATTWERESREDDRHRRIAGSTVLIVGTGGIGRALASFLGPLGATIIAVNRSGEPMPGARETHPVEHLHDVLGSADFVVLAAAHTPATHQLIDARALKSMRPDAWLINVARGGLVDTDALVQALRDGTIGGAALDVTEPEPLPDGHPLWTMDEVIITPHVANTWRMAIPDMKALIERNVRAFARGEPLEGLVDPALGY